jgi:hypothetical protein
MNVSSANVGRGAGGKHSPRKAEGFVRSDPKWCRDPQDLWGSGLAEFQIPVGGDLPAIPPDGPLGEATTAAEENLSQFAKEHCDEGTCRMSGDLCVPVIGKLTRKIWTWRVKPRRLVNGSEVCMVEVRLDATITCRCSSPI